MTKTKKKPETEVERNYRSFQKKLPEVAAAHGGKYALMSDGEIIEFYRSWNDAIRTGRKFYGDGNFSVQQVETMPVDLGFFSHAIV